MSNFKLVCSICEESPQTMVTCLVLLCERCASKHGIQEDDDAIRTAALTLVEDWESIRRYISEMDDPGILISKARMMDDHATELKRLCGGG